MPAGSARVPLHRSLLMRLLVASVSIAVGATGAAAWLTFRSTGRVIRQEQSRALTDDTDVYTTLIGYGATHPDWSGAGPLVAELGRRTHQRITLTTAPSTSVPSATVDPLRLNGDLTGRPADSIDPRAVGPYQLPAAEAAGLHTLATGVVACLHRFGLTGTIEEQPSGRPVVRVQSADLKDVAGQCTQFYLNIPTPTEQKALDALAVAIRACLHRPGLEIVLSPAFAATVLGRDPPPQGDVDACVRQGRRDQLRAYVAPPALLSVTSLDGDTGGPTFDLSRPSLVRIFGVTGLILAVAIAVTVLVGIRLVRPLRALATAARGPGDRPRRVAVTTRDEIGNLAGALNDLTDRREQLERQRREMVSDVAHELRSPLTNIRTWLEGAQDGVVPLDPQLLDLVLAEAVLLQHVIDDLRDLADADAGTLRLHPEPAYVNDLLAQVLDAHRETAKAAGVRLAAEPAGDPEVSLDPVRLRQMIGNLVANGVRHTPAGGTVTLHSGLTADGFLEIAVADTGTGIEPQDLPRVFDRFWRSDASRTRTTGGSGLGLSIVRRLAEAHGGTVTATSRPGRGSTFTVRLPTT